MNYDDIRKHIVENNAFSVSPIEGIGYSAGILFAMEKIEGFAAAVGSAVGKFCAGDFGDFYEYDEIPTPGKEFGAYESPLGSELSTGAIVVHREPQPAYDFVVYFQFER